MFSKACCKHRIRNSRPSTFSSTTLSKSMTATWLKIYANITAQNDVRFTLSGSHPAHPAGTSKDSDKCDLSKDSDMAPSTLGSMENTTFFYFTQETYVSKYLGEIYI